MIVDKKFLVFGAFCVLANLGNLAQAKSNRPNNVESSKTSTSNINDKSRAQMDPNKSTFSTRMMSQTEAKDSSRQVVNSDSWHGQNLMPTYADREQGDDMIALASSSDSLNESFLYPNGSSVIKPHQSRESSTGGRSNLSQHGKKSTSSNNNKYIPNDFMNDEYYQDGEEDDSLADAEDFVASIPLGKSQHVNGEQQHNQEVRKPLMIHIDEPQAIYQRLTDNNGSNTKVISNKATSEQQTIPLSSLAPLTLSSSSSSSAWIPNSPLMSNNETPQFGSSIKRPQMSGDVQKMNETLSSNGSRLASLLSHKEPIGSLNRADAAIEYLKSMLKSKQQSKNPSDTMNEQGSSGTQKGRVNLQRLSSIAIRLNQLLEQGSSSNSSSIGQERGSKTKTSSLSDTIGNKFSIIDVKTSEANAFAGYSNDRPNALNGTSVTSMMTSPISESRGSYEMIGGSQVDPSQLKNGTPLGGDYIESLDEFPRTSSPTKIPSTNTLNQKGSTKFEALESSLGIGELGGSRFSIEQQQQPYNLNRNSPHSSQSLTFPRSISSFEPMMVNSNQTNGSMEQRDQLEVASSSINEESVKTSKLPMTSNGSVGSMISQAQAQQQQTLDLGKESSKNRGEQSSNYNEQLSTTNGIHQSTISSVSSVDQFQISDLISRLTGNNEKNSMGSLGVIVNPSQNISLSSSSSSSLNPIQNQNQNQNSDSILSGQNQNQSQSQPQSKSQPQSQSQYRTQTMEIKQGKPMANQASDSSTTLQQPKIIQYNYANFDTNIKHSIGNFEEANNKNLRLNNNNNHNKKVKLGSESETNIGAELVATNYQLADALYSSSGNLEQILSGPELEAIKRQILLSANNDPIQESVSLNGGLSGNGQLRSNHQMPIELTYPGSSISGGPGSVALLAAANLAQTVGLESNSVGSRLHNQQQQQQHGKGQHRQHRQQQHQTREQLQLNRQQQLHRQQQQQLHHQFYPHHTQMDSPIHAIPSFNQQIQTNKLGPIGVNNNKQANEEILSELASEQDPLLGPFRSIDSRINSNSNNNININNKFNDEILDREFRRNKSQSQSQLGKVIDLVNVDPVKQLKQKSLIVYLNHPKSYDMVTGSPKRPSDIISAKELEAFGLNPKDSKMFDVAELRPNLEFESLVAPSNNENKDKDKDGLSVVVIDDAYKYKKIVLLISSKSGGLKFVPMVKDSK